VPGTIEATFGINPLSGQPAGQNPARGITWVPIIYIKLAGVNYLRSAWDTRKIMRIA